MVYVDLVGLFQIRIRYKSHSMLALTILDPAVNSQAALNLSKTQISQQHPSSICSIKLRWQGIRELNLLSLMIGVMENSNMSSN
jgi:hypothetical protein